METPQILAPTVEVQSPTPSPLPSPPILEIPEDTYDRRLRKARAQMDVSKSAGFLAVEELSKAQEIHMRLKRQFHVAQLDEDISNRRQVSACALSSLWLLHFIHNDQSVLNCIVSQSIPNTIIIILDYHDLEWIMLTFNYAYQNCIVACTSIVCIYLQLMHFLAIQVFYAKEAVAKEEAKKVRGRFEKRINKAEAESKVVHCSTLVMENVYCSLAVTLPVPPPPHSLSPSLPLSGNE